MRTHGQSPQPYGWEEYMEGGLGRDYGGPGAVHFDRVDISDYYKLLSGWGFEEAGFSMNSPN